MNISEEQKYQQAKKHVEKLKGFYIHLIIYIVVNIGLIFINLIVAGGPIWFIYPLIGWGIGLIGHSISILNFGKDWEKRQIEKYMNK